MKELDVDKDLINIEEIKLNFKKKCKDFDESYHLLKGKLQKLNKQDIKKIEFKFDEEKLNENLKDLKMIETSLKENY